MPTDKKFCLNCESLMIEVIGAVTVNCWVPCLYCGHETFFNMANQRSNVRLRQPDAAVPASHRKSNESLGASSRPVESEILEAVHREKA
jgi:hypothetical protein